MKIVKLEAQNVKRLKAVEIKPDGSIVKITGRNAQGKSSVLDSIAMALGGKALIPDRPIRDGEKKAKITVDLGEMVVTRAFSDGDSSLKITGKDGAKLNSPQSVLDKLAGAALLYDPLAFMRQESRKQVETLRALVGLDFTELNKQRAQAYDKRTEINRDIKSAGARLTTMPPAYAGVPASAESSGEIIARLQNAQSHNGLYDGKELTRQRNEEAIIEHERTIARLQAQNSELLDWMDANPKIDVAPIQLSLSSVEETNAKIRANAERVAIESSLKELESKSEGLTAVIESIDKQKLDTLAVTKFPVPELSIDDDSVIYRGVPIAQASSAEQLRVSVGIGLAMNPQLKVILIRDGSLLDCDNMAMIGDMADSAGAQIWVERVSDDDEDGIVIEDGMVAS